MTTGTPRHLNADGNSGTKAGENIVLATVKDDLKKLSNDLVAIENDFNYVTTSIIRLDKRNVLSVKFAPRWEGLHNTYTTLMHTSKKNAGDISNKLRDFLEVIVVVLTDSKFKMADREIQLSEHIKALESFISRAGENSKHFLRLKQDVLSFKEDLGEAVKNGKLVEEKLEEIDKKIVQLVATLQESLSFFTAIWNACIRHFLPEALGEIITVPLKPKKQALQEILFQYKFENIRKAVARTRKRFANVVNAVDDLEPVLERLSDKLEGIEHIWNFLLVDSRGLLDSLGHMMNGAISKDVFDRRVETTKSIYENLKESLDGYSLAVSTRI